MRSLVALEAQDFEKVLENQGSFFLNEVIIPSILPMVLHATSDDIHEVQSGKNRYRWKKRIPVKPEAKNILKKLLIGYNFATIEADILDTRIENCSCSDIEESEYKQSHTCAIREENKICIDLNKILSTKNPVQVNYNELVAMTWHEISHILAGKIDHEHGMALYQYVLKKSQSNMFFGLHEDRFTTFKNCKIRSKDVKKHLKDTTISECLSEMLIDLNKTQKMSARLYDHKGYSKKMIYTWNGSDFDPNKPLTCSLTTSTESWVRFIEDHTLAKMVGGISDPTKTYTTSIYKASNVWNPSFTANDIQSCLKHFYYRNLKDGQRLFRILRVTQGKFELKVID